MLGTLQEVWKIFNSPNNDPIVVSLLIGWFALLSSQISSFVSYRRVLNEKDRRIEELVEQRNLFQGIVLENKGIPRLSSKKSK